MSCAERSACDPRVLPRFQATPIVFRLSCSAPESEEFSSPRLESLAAQLDLSSYFFSLPQTRTSGISPAKRGRKEPVQASPLAEAHFASCASHDRLTYRIFSSKKELLISVRVALHGTEDFMP